MINIDWPLIWLVDVHLHIVPESLLIFFLGKLPKNYDPKATPDPERWLPMKERAYYRGKKKGKKKEQIGKGTQGAMAGASAELWVACCCQSESNACPHRLWAELSALVSLSFSVIKTLWSTPVMEGGKNT